MTCRTGFHIMFLLRWWHRHEIFLWDNIEWWGFTRETKAMLREKSAEGTKALKICTSAWALVLGLEEADMLYCGTAHSVFLSFYHEEIQLPQRHHSKWLLIVCMLVLLTHYVTHSMSFICTYIKRLNFKALVVDPRNSFSYTLFKHNLINKWSGIIIIM